MRIAIILLVLLLLPSAASAAMLTLYSPFDLAHNGHHGNPATPNMEKPPLVAGDALGGCGRGRIRDHLATHRCRGPADLH
jgi:hypothetical protein